MSRVTLHALASLVPQRLLRTLGRWLLGGPRRRALRARLSGAMSAGEVVVRRGPLAGARLRVAGSNPGYALGVSEPAVQEALARHLAPGDVVLDVGANVGFLTLIAARHVGPSGQVYACEPLPANAELLRANLEANGVCNVTVVEVALADRAEMRRLAVGPEDDGQLRAALAARGEAADGPVVAVETADALIAAGRCAAPDLVKIDVEGAEVEVLQGMERLLTDHRPVVICEIHDAARQGVLRAKVSELLTARGYAVTTLEREATAGMTHVLGLPPDDEGRPVAAPRDGAADGRP